MAQKVRCLLTFEPMLALRVTLMWTVEWNGDGEQTVASLSELDSFLDQLHAAGKPVIAVVESDRNGDSLAIGLGRDQSVLNFVPGSGDPPYFTSLSTADRDAVVEFDFMGQASEFPMRNSIPIDVARQVMREFLRTGKLSPIIQWEQD